MHDECADGSPGFVGALQPSAFVGRQCETEALDAALNRAIRFRAPQLVTVVGALGMGKTRLLAEWLRATQSPRVRTLRLSLSVDGPAGEAGGAIGRLLRQRFGLGPHLGPQASLVQFRAELQRVFGDRRVAEVAALLGRFLGFELQESPLSQALAGIDKQRPELSRAVLCRFLEQDAAQSPLVVAIDDLHVADDESLDVFDHVIGELGEAPLLIVVAARPELLVRRPAWGRGDGSHTRLELGPLSARAIDAMIRSILGATGPEPLPTALVMQASRESGGNPHLLEQVLHLFRRQEVLVAEEGQGWWFDDERAALQRLTLSPEEAAQSRVGALSPVVRDVLIRAAAFGPVFWTGGIVALGRLGAEPPDPNAVFAADPAIPHIRSVLEDLRARDVLVAAEESRLPGDSEWSFKHPRDIEVVLAGCDPELLARRRRFAAQWLESRGGAGREARFEMLGELYEHGGDERRAAYCYLTAAADARSRMELERSRTLYLRSLRLLQIDDAVAKMDVLYAVGDVAARLGRTREALAHFQEMLRIAWRLDLPAKGGAAHGRMGRLHGTLGEHGAALNHLEIARRLFQIAGDMPGVASTLDDIGRMHFLGGAPETSLDYHRMAYQVRNYLGDERGKALALARMGQVEHELGDLVAAGGHLRKALELRRWAGDRQGVVASLLDLGSLERDLGHVEQAIAILDEGRALAREIGERLYECSIAVELGDCCLVAAKPVEARPHFVAAKEIARQFGAKLLLSEATRGLAEVELSRGDAVTARDEARLAYEIAMKIGSPPLAGAALRVMAAAVAHGAAGDAELGGAREMFDRAVELLTHAGAELELGRVLAAYAEFEDRIGRRAAAQELRRQADLTRAGAKSHAKPSASAKAATTPVSPEAAAIAGF